MDVKSRFDFENNDEYQQLKTRALDPKLFLKKWRYICSGCIRYIDTKPTICSCCRVEVYCDERCQRKDWIRHQKLCFRDIEYRQVRCVTQAMIWRFRQIAEELMCDYQEEEDF